jgi:hypothetical protein
MNDPSEKTMAQITNLVARLKAIRGHATVKSSGPSRLWKEQANKMADATRAAFNRFREKK